MKTVVLLVALVILAVAAGNVSAGTRSHADSTPASPQVALDWNAYAVAAVRAARTMDGVPAGGSPRAFYQVEGLIYMAYVEAAVYDALTKIDHGYRPYHHFEAGGGNASPEAAVATAAYATLGHYLGDPTGALAAHYAASIGALPTDMKTTRGIAVGQAAAADIELLRAGDGLDAPTAVFGAPFVYDASNAGQWQVVPPSVAVGAQTPWVASMRPFTLVSPSAVPRRAARRAWKRAIRGGLQRGQGLRLRDEHAANAGRDSYRTVLERERDQPAEPALSRRRRPARYEPRRRRPSDGNGLDHHGRYRNRLLRFQVPLPCVAALLGSQERQPRRQSGHDG
jgi:hypothetical protein